MVYPIALLVWSDHGNFIATAHIGTDGLRTDFTRTGVRKKKGVVVHKLTSKWRYTLNSHSDGYKQVRDSQRFGLNIVITNWIGLSLSLFRMRST